MRILHFYKTAHPDTMGGVEQVIHQVCQQSYRFGVTCEVLALSKNPSPTVIETDGYRIHQVKENFKIASTGFSIQAYSKFKELAQNADIINYHFPWPFMDVIHFASRIRKPSVVSYHSDIVDQKQLLKLYRPLQTKFLSSVNRIIVSSPNYLESSSVLPIFREKISIIPIGLNKESYPTPSPALITGWASQLPGRFFLFVGVMRYYKGLHTLLEAVQGTGYPLVIVGDGPKKQDLMAQAEKLRLRNVHFLGQIDDESKIALIQLSTAVVFPSHLRSEAFGIALLEGAMYGKPMISCEIGTGTTYINIANETGLTVPPEDPVALRQAMRYLWDNPLVAEVMGEKAQLRYQQVFTGDQMLKGYTEVYQSVMNEQR
ncbi:glycosyltransferase family 4 protein [Pseudomonas costantinii]|uniref:glycosyltransferase family 4 protein n=1 Tax=Pseudomonas costantinii TaxID=168469 RepID=UPI00159FC060|nr:glycosyltransferase family 4 protein [Pseudomonas costantinii]NVZ72994.1 glycosyltransferase [Pseudomonas costantinii]